MCKTFNARIPVFWLSTLVFRESSDIPDFRRFPEPHALAEVWLGADVVGCLVDRLVSFFTTFSPSLVKISVFGNCAGRKESD